MIYLRLPHITAPMTMSIIVPSIVTQRHTRERDHGIITTDIIIKITLQDQEE